jgi:hypothetical protein
VEQAPPAGHDWLEHRFALFERFCLPSVEAQTCADFDWIIFCNPDIPRAFLERLRGYSRFRALQPIYFRNTFDQGMARAAVGELARRHSHLITTRLDNDDAISRTFVETIQQNFRGQEYEFLNFTNGLIWKDGEIRSGRHSSNAFISLVENAENYTTVYCGNHMELDQRGPIAQIAKPAAWLQVVHSRNLSNQVWGTPESGMDLTGAFGIKL